MHLHVLASGSKGNASIIESDTTCVLVDCGISCKRLKERAQMCGIDLHNISAVFLTHEHADHINGLPVFLKNFNVPVFATAQTMQAHKKLQGLPYHEITHSEHFEYRDIHVQAFQTFHDVCDPVGYCFHEQDDSIGICTDTGVVGNEATDALRGVRILALEANHDEKMLKTGDYPAYLKRRIASNHGHLSNAQTAEFLPKIANYTTEAIVAMHLSHENNRPSLAIKACAQALGANPCDTTFTKARMANGCTIQPASQEIPVSIM